MPNNKNAEKRDRQSKVARVSNRSAKSAVRGLVKTVEKAIDVADKQVAIDNVTKMIKGLDTAARKGLIKKNTAARKKSRLVKKINAM